MMLFFSSFHLHHRDLHSFPTRRSSDLPSSSAILTSVTTTSTSALSRPWSADRSEEHTSELQSHHDLVCRLLLEKKKHLNSNNIQNSYAVFIWQKQTHKTICTPHGGPQQ